MVLCAPDGDVCSHMWKGAVSWSLGTGEQAWSENCCWLWGDRLRGREGGNVQQGMPTEEDWTATEAGHYCWVTRRGRSHYCSLFLPTCWRLPVDNKRSLSGLALRSWLWSNKKSPLWAGPHTPDARQQKKPSQSWPSWALCQVPEKALTRAISLAPVAASFPAHLVPPGLPRSKQS